MVYTGPSEGCHLCRRRRIKCDGGRPGCQRCAIYKAECPGYRRESDYKFVNESSASSSRTASTDKRKPALASRSRVKQKTSPTSSSSDAAALPSISPPLAQALPGNTAAAASQTHPVWQASTPQIRALVPAVPAQPSTDWEEWSATAFLHDWTMPDTVSGFGVGFLDFLPDLCAKASPDLDLSQALRAASLALFANQHGSQPMMSKARTAYGQALTALNISLRNPVDAVKDTTISTIILLQIFEHIVSDDSLSLGNHDAGLRMLLDMRGDAQMDTERGRGIARIVFGYLFSRNVNQKHETCGVMRRGAHRLGYPPEHPSRQRRPGSSGMPELLRDMGPLLDQNPDDSRAKTEAFRLMQEAISFDQIYDRWTNLLPPGWIPHELYIPPSQVQFDASAVPQSGFIHMYHSPLHACYSTLYRMQFVVLHKRLIVTARHFGIEDWSLPPSELNPEGYHASIDHSASVVRQRIHEVLSCAACALGEISATGQPTHMTVGRSVGAYYLLWPLMAISGDDFASPEQKEDARRALAYIGNVLGVRRAIRHPNRPRIMGNSPRSDWDNPEYRKSSPSNSTSTSNSGADRASASTGPSSPSGSKGYRLPPQPVLRAAFST